MDTTGNQRQRRRQRPERRSAWEPSAGIVADLTRRRQVGLVSRRSGSSPACTRRPRQRSPEAEWGRGAQRARTTTICVGGGTRDPSAGRCRRRTGAATAGRGSNRRRASVPSAEDVSPARAPPVADHHEASRVREHSWPRSLRRRVMHRTGLGSTLVTKPSTALELAGRRGCAAGSCGRADPDPRVLVESA